MEHLEAHEIKSVIARSRELGMIMFDQALFDLFALKDVINTLYLHIAIFACSY